MDAADVLGEVVGRTQDGRHRVKMKLGPNTEGSCHIEVLVLNVESCHQ